MISREDPEQDLKEVLEAPDLDQEEFWRKVKTNLQAGKVRLIFVADEIPADLRRVVEFLNQQMDPAEVLAIEIKQYAGQGMKTLVPRVVGQTVEAQQKKSGVVRQSRQWDEISFFEKLEEERGASETAIAKRILEWSRSRTTFIWWGKGKTAGSFIPQLTHEGVNHQLFAVWTYGVFEFYFLHYQYKIPFEPEEKRLELLERLNAIPGISIPADSIARRPSVYLSSFSDEAVLEQLLETFYWVVREIEAS
jgi:hypothetical protein